ncbi:conserved hypothetical protein [Dinoroseobacter shibae DFL 12 = DSM 16493]|jgi:uncharacterized phiE125 gp8 family phage protein|uniref:Phage gp6-like head-tail connector protein n=2 Tax=root TaxID=1 RepID=A8LQP2_DINSH|nr:MULTISPECIES: hypothetical protein [Dinoroseobacter]DBA12234.1 TPA_asm: hypothetical protein [Dinogtaviriform tomaschi]ABV93909.1 conserved hypothetical protein [Dinoroseobacter shibae DFL 12 = DSM 16493]MDD9716576.1 hypothetical protein [Dinoroseobacter sp. PD6]URF45357.1 hypothetical protein M8008_11230 [Dinoroseobacter shibae]URF49662.1 hypothetical protein M8007_11230 [Dinoroseobacter shibae]
MNLSEVTSVPLASLPLQEFRDHLRLGRGFEDDSLQDIVLETALLAAINAIEDRTGKALLQREFRLELTHWEGPCVQSLPRGPLIAVRRLAIMQMDGSMVELSEGDYSLLHDTFRPGLRAKGGFPQIPTHGSVQIDFEAGYGPQWSDVPGSLAQAVFILAAHFYEARDGQQSRGFPALVRTLISAFRDVRIFGGRRK